MSINKKKVLGISLREYCESRGKRLNDYCIEGVHVSETIKRSIGMRDSIKQKIIDIVPEDAEVVVGYCVSFTEQERYRNVKIVSYEANGHALIPRRDKLKRK